VDLLKLAEKSKLDNNNPLEIKKDFIHQKDEEIEKLN
jgi:hypothetical protein